MTDSYHMSTLNTKKDSTNFLHNLAAGGAR